MKRFSCRKVAIFALIFCYALLQLPTVFNQKTAEAQTLTEKQQAAVAMAKHYYMRGADIQYDQKSLDESNSSAPGSTTGRRELNVAPELASSQRTVYMDCSSYVYNIYRVGFNFNFNADLIGGTTTKALIDWAKNNSAHAVNIMYHELNSQDNKTAVLNSFKACLEVGDIIVYRKGSSIANETGGHTMIYIGDNTLLHSTGSSYNYAVGEENWEDIGTVRYMSVDALTQSTYNEPSYEDDDDSSTPTTSTRYFYHGDKTRFAVLRMLNHSSNPTFTAETESRMNSGLLYLHKTTNPDINHTVHTGQEITYTVTMENRNDSALAVSLSDSIPSGTTFVSVNGATHSSGNISYSKSLAKDESVTISYTVRVTATSGTISSNNTLVNGINAGKLSNRVGKALSSGQQLILNNTVSAYAEKLSSSHYSASAPTNAWQTAPSAINSSFRTNTHSFIRAVYKQAFNLDIEYSALTVPFDSLANANRELYQNAPGTFTATQLAYFNMQVPNLYGGNRLTTYNNSNARIARVRRVMSNQLMVGDIVTQKDGSLLEAFLAIERNNGIELVTFSSSGISYYSGEHLNTLLSKLLSKDQFVILRPSLAYNATSIAVAPASEVQVLEKTANSITVSPIEGAEYSKDNGTTWQDSNVLSGLLPSQTYQVTARIKAVANLHSASPKTSAVSVTTFSGGNYVELSSQTLETAQVDSLYQTALEAVGSGELSFSLVSGSLPQGINLHANGTLSGTPTSAGTFNFTVKAELNTLLASDQKQFSITVDKANGRGTVSLPNWEYGTTEPTPVLNNIPSEYGAPTFEYQHNMVGAFTSVKPTNVGAHTIRAKFNATANYNAYTTSAFVFNITKASGSGTLSVVNWAFGQTANTPTLNDVPSQYGAPSFEYQHNQQGDYISTVPTVAGTHNVRAVFAQTTNYEPYTTPSVTFVIEKAEGRGSVSVNSWAYGTSPSRHNLVDVPEEYGAPVYEYKLRNADDSTYTTQKPTEVGLYTVRARFAETQNYKEFVTDGTNFAIIGNEPENPLPFDLKYIAISGAAILFLTVVGIIVSIKRKR